MHPGTEGVSIRYTAVVYGTAVVAGTGMLLRIVRKPSAPCMPPSVHVLHVLSLV